MRVLIIAAGYIGAGGIRAAREVFHALPELGATPTMLVPRRRDTDPPAVLSLRNSWEKYLRAVEWIAGPADWRHLGSKALLSRIGRGDYDVVHLHNLHGGWVSLRAVHDLCERIPAVWTFHDEFAITPGRPYDMTREPALRTLGQSVPRPPGEPAPGTRAARRFDRFMSKWMPKPRAIICPSAWLTKLSRACPWFAKTPVHEIPYACTMLDRPESTMPRDEARRAFGIAPDERVVLVIAANLKSIYKGMWLGAEALGKLSGRKLRLLVLGGGADALTSRLPFEATTTGFITDESLLAKAYRSADLAMIPSVVDNFPYVGLESLACGTPIVVFRVGGLAEMAGANERGLVAECFDSGQLADCMGQLLDEPDRAAALGTAGRAWVQTHCATSTAMAANVAVYRQAIAAASETASAA